MLQRSLRESSVTLENEDTVEDISWSTNIRMGVARSFYGKNDT